MAKKKEMGLVKINQSSINRVKKKIIGTKTTIGGYYEALEINSTKTNKQ